MRLIDADALKELRDDYIRGRIKFDGDEYDLIDKCPTIEVEPVKHSNPLTIDELRTMHGKPVWIEQENTWGIVCVDKGGLWKDIPFVVFFFKNVRCEYGIEDRGLTCYHHEPVKHGRWVFRDPDNYGNRKPYCTNCGKYHLTVWSDYTQCNYCPNCGAKMDGGGNED